MHVVLATLFAVASAAIIVYNVRGILGNLELGTRYRLVRMAQLVQEIEGVGNPSKQEMINLTLGDGMRFFAYLRERLPEDTLLIFPSNASNAEHDLQPEEIGRVGAIGFRATLHPRKLKGENYDFQRLPYSPGELSTLSQKYNLSTLDYSHSSLHFVFQVFLSPDTKQYRFFYNVRPVAGQASYHTEILMLMFPEGPER